MATPKKMFWDVRQTIDGFNPIAHSDYMSATFNKMVAFSDGIKLGICGPVGCVDADTEYLTPGGWRKISKYQQGDLVVAQTQVGERICLNLSYMIN